MIFLDEMSNEDVDRAGTLYNAYAERVKSLGFDGVIVSASSLFHALTRTTRERGVAV